MWTLISSFFVANRSNIIIGALIAALAGGAYFYFTYSQDKIANLEKAQAQQELRIAAFEETIKQIKVDAAETKQHQDELNSSLTGIRTSVERQKAVVDGVDLNKQADADALALEKKINAATAKTLKTFEDLSK